MAIDQAILTQILKIEGVALLSEQVLYGTDSLLYVSLSTDAPEVREAVLKVVGDKAPRDKVFFRKARDYSSSKPFTEIPSPPMTKTDYHRLELALTINQRAQKSKNYKNVVFTADDFTQEEIATFCELREKAENTRWEVEINPLDSNNHGLRKDYLKLRKKAQAKERLLDTFFIQLIRERKLGRR